MSQETFDGLPADIQAALDEKVYCEPASQIARQVWDAIDAAGREVTDSTVVTEFSLITPPVGLNVFVLKGVIRDVPTSTIFRGLTPLWISDLFRLALLAAVPAITLFLPNLMM